jgi:cysteinyl-tRNA synthetase
MGRYELFFNPQLKGKRRHAVDPFIIILAVIVLLAVLRLRATYRRVKKFDRSDEIRKKLAELKKRRDDAEE